MRAGKLPVFWIVLAAVYLIGAGLTSVLAPCGNWVNSIFGVLLWEEADPGGQYLLGAHGLLGQLWLPPYSSQHPAVHPGITLELLLDGIQRLLHAAASVGGSSLPFTEYTGRHLVEVFVASKLAMTGLHLASFYLLYRLARALDISEMGARISVLLYATSLPVLYFASRIAPEPIMMICAFGAFLSLWRSLDAPSATAARRWAALSAFCAASGAVTKLFLMLPLLGLLPLAMGLAGERRDGTARAPGERASTIVTFAVAAVATLAVYSLFFSWREFFGAWERVGQAIQSRPGGATFWTVAAQLVPGVTRNGAFLFFESLLLAAGLVGAGVWFLPGAHRPARILRIRMLWILAHAAFTSAVWFYRGLLSLGRAYSDHAEAVNFAGFHYLFFVTSAAALLAGTSAERLLSLKELRSPRVAALVAAALVFAIHQPSIWAVVNSRARDAHVYRHATTGSSPRLLHEGLRRAGSGRVGVVSQGPVDLRMGLLYDPFVGKESGLLQACVSNFRVARWLEGTSAETIAVEFARQGVTVVVDELEPDGALLPLGEWRAWRGTSPPRVAGASGLAAPQ